MLLEKGNDQKKVAIENLKKRLESEIKDHLEEKKVILKEKSGLEKEKGKLEKKLEIMEEQINKFAQENSILLE